MKLLSPYHRRPRNLWVSGRLTLFITILLFWSVIKCNFPSFLLDRIQSALSSYTCMFRPDRKTNLHVMFPRVRPQTPVSWLVTWAASVTRTLSLCHVITGPQPASVSAPVTETQLRSGKWYLSIMGHGTDRGSGNALQIGGTMPGLARHHYTIINLMSLCEEIWIIEMASHLSLLTAPWCVLRVPRIPEWRWWHLINIINVKPCMMAASAP